MARAQFKAFLVKNIIEEGNPISKKETYGPKECAQFVRSRFSSYNFIDHKIFFEVHAYKRMYGKKDNMFSDLVYWWANVLKEHGLFTDLEFIGEEETDNEYNNFLITLKIPEKACKAEEDCIKNGHIDNVELRDFGLQIQSFTLLEFSLLRFAWAEPYRYVIHKLYLLKDLIEENGFDLFEIFTLLHLIVRSSGYREAWSQYFSLYENEDNEDYIFSLFKFKDMIKIFEHRDTKIKFFTIFGLFSNELLCLKDLTTVKIGDINSFLLKTVICPTDVFNNKKDEFFNEIKKLIIKK